MYLDFAEDQARRKKPMHMAEWVQRLDAFLQFNERNILTHAGVVSTNWPRNMLMRSSSGTTPSVGGWRLRKQAATWTSSGWR